MILREKILLGVVGVAAIGAAIVYAPAVFSPSSTKSTRPPIDFPALTTRVQGDLKKGKLTALEDRVLTAATAEWLRNPLRERMLVIDTPTESVAPPPEYVVTFPEYVGYLSIGDNVIAIIDGQDYRLGDEIAGGEFTLTRIQPNYIQLLRRGATDPVNVPLEKPHITGKQPITEEPQ